MPGPGFAAVILAAGYSSRMGRSKPLLDLDGKPVIARVLETFREAGVEDLAVVAGYRWEDIAPVVEALGARTVVNDSYETGMFSSVAAGLEAAGHEARAIFVHPADIPLVRPATLRRLSAEFDRGAGRILVPCFMGRRGHPVLIAAETREGIAGYGGGGGLKSAIGAVKGTVAAVDVCDSNILFDMDGPGDYEAVKARWPRRGRPSQEECEALWKLQEYDYTNARGHCLFVAGIAAGITRDLNRCGRGPDPETVAAAALLHDLARDRPGHARLSADIAREAGFGEAAAAIGQHMDITLGSGGEVSAAEVLYLADKLADGSARTTLAAGLEKQLARYRDSPAILEAVQRRYNNARLISRKVGEITGSEPG